MMDLQANTLSEFAVWGTGGVVLASMAGSWIFKFKRRQTTAAREAEAHDVIAEARREGESLLREARLNANRKVLWQSP